MKYILSLIAVFVLCSAASIFAGQDEYDECLLKYLPDARVDVATGLMVGACRESYKDFSILSEKRKKYNACLLEYLPGMESGDAVLEIRDLCVRRYL